MLGTLTLPGAEPFVGLARTFVRGLLPEGHPSSDDVVAVTGELVANAVLHSDSGKSGGLVTITLEERHGVFVLEVTDDGGGRAGGCLETVPAQACSANPSPNAIANGQGLRIVELLAQRWGVLYDAGHTIVWAEFAR